jgi:protein-S-isoprenylcysteine O-methyltransferase Ste14
MNLQATREEDYLEKAFGEEYTGYKKRIGW